MVSAKYKNRGFTIVELLIVIVVIGILAALVIVTYTGIQQRARDTERKTDINAIHGQVEAYYAQNGAYPALADINTSTWRDANITGLDDAALQDPRGTVEELAATASNTQYGYAVFQTDGTTACTTAAGDCAVYTLTANLEAGGTYTKGSLN
ncbi:hypothetical protein A3A68_02355 [Candidatus Saccharibacteria bacterium RIFCSPLOWO2_01_FULL_48_13]|nr:MAG: hypothetical protein A2884_00135 [Candidatus Saccharibacteria bacterium RIFCSPHIGHO2_01_FULL_48_12]OGL36079.1 MAG: hypothetical protein A3F38_00545 [Candidatus Saccharibacteria bacterium RIFCSPHIGHO2_12_FULL_48_21]OGL36764.1 MAG: hypothetical protein A3A68_02355 [Candidatus Saccharibacteria bacterium RIFCSPLOWO2_01_FULL_48_13]